MPYVEEGYNEPGYIDGDAGFILPPEGGVKLKFFISRGDRTEEEEKTAIRDAIEDNEVALLYSPKLSKMSMINKDSTAEFVSSDIDVDTLSLEIGALASELLDNETYAESLIDKLGEEMNLHMNVTLNPPPGVVAVAPNVTREREKLTFSVPPELEGILFDVVMEVRTSKVDT